MELDDEAEANVGVKAGTEAEAKLMAELEATLEVSLEAKLEKAVAGTNAAAWNLLITIVSTWLTVVQLVLLPIRLI